MVPTGTNFDLPTTLCLLSQSAIPEKAKASDCMGVRREVLRGVHQIQLGVWGKILKLTLFRG